MVMCFPLVLVEIVFSTQCVIAESSSSDTVPITYMLTFECWKHVEYTLQLSLDEMSICYSRNHLKPNPVTIHICCFNLRNRDAKLNVAWHVLELDYYTNPICLGVTLDRTLSFKQNTLTNKANVTPEIIFRGN